MTILGNIGDQLGYIVWGGISDFPFRIADSNISEFWVYQRLFAPNTTPWLSSQPLITLFLSFFLSIFDSWFLNLFALLTAAANLFVSQLYFKKYKYGFFYSLIFSFSSYFWIHLGVHTALMQIWIIPLFFYLLEKARSSEKRVYTNYLFLGVFLGISGLISNYYAFFSFLVLGVFLFIDFFRYLKTKNKVILKAISGTFISGFTGGLIILIILFPFFKASYIDKTPFKANYLDSSNLQRTIEDFVSFSSRPWYFVIPHQRSLFYSNISENLVSVIASTNYFLADDYFGDEHSGAFFGYVFLFVLGSSILRFFIDWKKKGRFDTKTAYFLLISVVLILFMMPPYITISGFKIFTPGYLIFKYISVLRVTSRISIFVLFTFLVVIAQVIQTYEENSKSKPIPKSIALLFTVFILVETYVPVKINSYQNPPQEVVMISQRIQNEDIYMVYPFEKSREHTLWLSFHKKKLINPRGFDHRGFNSAVFTNEFVEKDNFGPLKELEVDYILVYRDELDGTEIKYFSDTGCFEQVSSSGDANLYKVKNSETIN